VRVDGATREPQSAFYGGSWGSLGDYGYLRNLTTNQKVAGSSPAERAPEIPANAAFLPLGIDVMGGLYHPFDHLASSKRLRRGCVCVCPESRIATRALSGSGRSTAQATVQSSTSRSRTRPNSRMLLVTSVTPMLTAWAAIRVSSGPIGVPVPSRVALTRP
jgi:hypothetical protein